MKILVTGAAGFIASGLVHKLAEQGHDVHAMVRNINKAQHLQHPNVQLFNGDINDVDSIQTAVKGCEQVYHIAAYARMWAKDRNEFFKVNLEGTKNMLNAAVQNGVSKFVFTSSTGVLGATAGKVMTEADPRTSEFDNDYEYSKHLAEEEVRKFAADGFNAVIVNPSRVYGPGPLSYSNAVSKMIIQALKGKRVVVPGGNAVGNYAFVNDVIDGHIKAMDKGVSGERYILGGENISYLEFLDVAKNQLGEFKSLRLSLPVMKLAGNIELLRAKLTNTFPAITPKMLGRYFVDATYSTKKAESEIGYVVTPFSEGIAQTIQYIRQNLL